MPAKVTSFGADKVVIWFTGPPDTFDNFAPEAQKLVDSMQWNGS